MSGETIAWPQKTRELHNHYFDSTIWNDFKFRDDDIVIATYAKAGTTWLQQIISQLIFDGEEGLEVAAMSPWLDLRVTNGHVYVSSMSGTVTLLRPGETLEVVAVNQLGEPIMATPGFVDDTIYVRAGRHLYAFATRVP